ncbi:hypothetical protein N8766_06500 [bacterium]|nr:hypothetical protein [bacterium]
MSQWIGINSTEFLITLIGWSQNSVMLWMSGLRSWLLLARLGLWSLDLAYECCELGGSEELPGVNFGSLLVNSSTFGSK